MKFFHRRNDFNRLGHLDKAEYILDSLNHFLSFINAHPSQIQPPLMMSFIFAIIDAMELSLAISNFLDTRTKIIVHTLSSSSFSLVEALQEHELDFVRSQQRGP